MTSAQFHYVLTKTAFWCSKITPQGLKGSSGTYFIFHTAHFHTALPRPRELPHRVSLSQFNHSSKTEYVITRWEMTVKDRLSEPLFSSAFKTHCTVCVAHSLHSMTPQSQLLSRIPALLYLYQWALKPNSSLAYQIPFVCIWQSEQFKELCRNIFVIFSSKVK